MMMFGNPNMGTDMDTVHLVMSVHECINVYQGLPPCPNVHH